VSYVKRANEVYDILVTAGICLLLLLEWTRHGGPRMLKPNANRRLEQSFALLYHLNRVNNKRLIVPFHSSLASSKQSRYRYSGQVTGQLQPAASSSQKGCLQPKLGPAATQRRVSVGQTTERISQSIFTVEKGAHHKRRLFERLENTRSHPETRWRLRLRLRRTADKAEAILVRPHLHPPLQEPTP